jgi:hypothetical protein
LTGPGFCLPRSREGFVAAGFETLCFFFMSEYCYIKTILFRWTDGSLGLDEFGGYWTGAFFSYVM